MTNETVRILIIEDDLGLLKAYISRLSSPDYEIDGTQEMDEARQLVNQMEYAVILTDLKLHTSDEGGLEILSEVKKAHPDTQVIIFSGVGDSQAVIRAFRLSADGYLTKPLDFNAVKDTIKNSIGVYLWQKSLRSDQSLAIPLSTNDPAFVAPEPFYFYAESMTKIIRRAKRLYRTSENILITGEPGTGKSLLAEGIHRGSGRQSFELVNCAGLSDITLEPLLFGRLNEDNSYDLGILERIQGGTLVLDRVTGLGLQLQKRLLEALGSKVFIPVPDADPIPLNLRIISIDEGYLEDDVEQGLFLPELYELLSRAHLHVPSLRERYDESYRDAIILAQQFISQKYNSNKQLDPETEYMIEQYPFPGNVSELDRIIRQAIGSVMEGELILPEHLPPRMLRFGVRPGLGAVEARIRVLCPHGPFHCDRTATIATAHRSIKGVYIRLTEVNSLSLQSALSEQLRQLGMTPLFVEDIPNRQTMMCNTCVPAQSCHYAIVDASHAESDILYDLGLLDALGTPTLIVSDIQADSPTFLETKRIKYYENTNQLVEIIRGWLEDYL